MPDQPKARFVFGPHVYDGRSGQLLKHGIRIKLQPKARALLCALLSRPGELVSREELRHALWPDGTYVDFEHGLNMAIKKLRDSLCDSADSPTYVETCAGEGYRFVGTVETIVEAPQKSGLPATATRPEPVPSTFALVSQSDTRNGWWMWRWIGAAAMAAAIVFSTIGWRYSHHPTLLPRITGWVLIADFDNRSGNPLLNGSLEYALQRELSNSQFVKVVPRERVQDALRLMKRPPDTRVDAAVGREIMLRDGEIGALLTGRVEKIGATYVLSTDIVDHRGVTVASFSDEDLADTKLAATIRRLSNRVRKRLGEQPDLIEQNDQNLQKVTTPSLRALQLYTRADNVMREFAVVPREADSTAVQLLEDALKEDPDFASAHLLLAYAYDDLALAHLGDRRQNAALLHFKRAYELADTTPQRERLFIIGAYYQKVKHDFQRAAEAYSALVRLYPDHYWAVNNLSRVYRHLNEPDLALHFSVRRAELRPNDLSVSAEAMWDALMAGDWRQAEQIHRHSSHLLDSPATASDPEAAQVVRITPACVLWFQGKFEQARVELVKAAAAGNAITVPASYPGTPPPVLADFFFSTLGELHESETRLRSEPELAAPLAYFRGDLAAARDDLARGRGQHSYWAPIDAILLARIGDVRDAEVMQRQIDTRGLPLGPPAVAEVDGEITFARGEIEKARSLLQRGLNVPVDSLGSMSGLPYLLAAEDLAKIYHHERRSADAIRILQDAARIPVAPIDGYQFSFRAKIQLELADLYRETGRTQDAENIEAELRRELVFADRDHPVLLALQHEHRSHER